MEYETDAHEQVEHEHDEIDQTTAADDGGYSLSCSDVKDALEAAIDARSASLDRLERMRNIIAGEIETTTKPVDGVEAFEPFAAFTQEKRPALNALQEAFDAASQLFAVPAVDVKVESRTVGKEGPAAMQGIRLEARSKSIKLAQAIETARDCALMCGEGYVRLGVLVGQSQSQLTGELRDVGEIFAQAVLPEDVLCDPNAPSWELQTWRAIRTLMPRRLAMKIYGKDERTRRMVKNMPAYFSSNEKQPTASLRQRNVKCEDADVLSMVEIWEFYLFVEGKVRWAVFPNIDRISDKDGPLQDWADYEEGFEGGPLVRMSFQQLPGLPNGVAPVAKLAVLHNMLEDLSGRIMQALREAKSVTYGTEDDKTLVEQAKAGPDGAHLTRTGGDGQPIEVLNLPYPSADAYKGLAFLRGEINNKFVNLAQIAGKYGVSDTATEAAMLNNNAQKLLAAMQETLDNFISDTVSLMNRWLMLLDRTGRSPEVEQYKYQIGDETTMLVLDEVTREDTGEDLDLIITARASRARMQDPMQRAALRTQLMMQVPSIIQAYAQAQLDPVLAIDILAEEHDWPKLSQMVSGVDAESMLAEQKAASRMSMNVGVRPAMPGAMVRPPAESGVKRPPLPMRIGAGGEA